MNNSIIFGVLIIIIIIIWYYVTNDETTEEFNNYDYIATVVRTARDNKTPISDVMDNHSDKFTALEYLQLVDHYDTNGKITGEVVKKILNQ